MVGKTTKINVVEAVAQPDRGAYKGAPDLAERGAARLAHQSGGLGVVGSNPAAPTIQALDLGKGG